MKITEITHKMRAIFSENIMVALNCVSPDQKTIIYSIFSEFVANSNQTLFQYDLALGLKEAIAENKEIAEWKNTKKFPTLPRGENPFRHYLNAFIEYRDDCILIIRDMERFIGNDSRTDWVLISLLKQIYHEKNRHDLDKKLVIIGENIDLHKELYRHLEIIKVPLPTIEEFLISLQINFKGNGFNDFELEQIAKSASGLSYNELYDKISRSNFESKLDSDNIISTVNSYKIGLLRTQGIEIVSTDDIPQVGGHEEFKQWLKQIEPFRNPKTAQALGLPKPKGCFLAGIPGCGKTLIAKQIAKSWNLPLFILNLPALKGSLVGESERNLKKTLDLVDSQTGIILMDEVDKAINIQSKNDSSGVGSGMLSILLPWLEQNHNFICMTANDPSVVPQELTRNGRLDQRWFVDLPDEAERQEIIEIHCLRNNRVELSPEQLKILIDEIANATEGFSGSEIENLIIQALYQSYLEGKPKAPSIGLFRELIRNTIPLSISFERQYQSLKEWSKNARCTRKDATRTSNSYQNKFVI